MYLHKLSITNFRKYGEIEGEPGIVIKFNKGLNVLIGENTSGKTTIVDAIRYVLQTQSYDYIRIDEQDFHYNIEKGERAKSLRIECEFRGFKDEEAANFLEWIAFDGNGEYVLKVWLSAQFKENRIIPELRAGADNVGIRLDAGARDLLRVTYLKPLRDAEMEMAAGRRSRFAQLLKSREEFKCKTKEEEKEHPLSKLITHADAGIKHYFTGDSEYSQQINKDAIELIDELVNGSSSNNEPLSDDQVAKLEEIREFLDLDINSDGKDIINIIRESLSQFTSADEPLDPFVTLSGVELWEIVQRLTLNIDNNVPSLGLMNLLYIAAELMLLKREGYTGLKLAIIEELEAHLHPHYQINTLKYFTDKVDDLGQVFLTTHSVVLGSSVPLNSLFICKGNVVYPIGNPGQYTEIDEESAYFLERFLDATKANLFYAKGVIIVEGYSENLLIPALAEVIGLPLSRYGVSIVNVGSTAWERYVRIFMRTDGKEMPVRVAIVSDEDIPCKAHIEENPPEVYRHETESGEVLLETDRSRFNELLRSKNIPAQDNVVKAKLESYHIDSYIALKRNKLEESDKGIRNGNVEIFRSEWTLEYSLARSVLKNDLLSAMQKAKDLSEMSVALPNDSSDAYLLMKPFSSKLSKALTAQILAKHCWTRQPKSVP